MIRPKTLKHGYIGQKWPTFKHFWSFWGSKFFDQQIIGGYLSHIETQLQAKKTETKLNVQGCRTESHA